MARKRNPAFRGKAGRARRELRDAQAALDAAWARGAGPASLMPISVWVSEAERALHRLTHR